MRKKKNRAMVITLAAALVFVAVIAGIIAIIAKQPAQKEEMPVSSEETYSKPIFDIPEVEESDPIDSVESSEEPSALEVLIDGEPSEENSRETVDRDTVSLPVFEEPKDYGPDKSE